MSDTVAIGRDDERALAVLRRHGTQSTSFQTLEPGLLHAYEGDGYVAFVDIGRAWVAAGGPIGPAAESAERAQRFIALAHARGKRACLFGVAPSLAERAGLSSLALGAEPCWDPRDWRQVLSSSRTLREQIRRARAKDVVVRQLCAAELEPGQETRRRTVELARQWLRTRSMAPMGFLVQLDLFGHADERLYLAAERGEQLVGLLVAVPIYRERGWLVEDLLRAPSSPNGTSELLVDRAMKRFADLGCPLVSMGMAPLAGEVAPALQAIRSLTGWLYNFEGVRAFKQKLRPARWQPVVVAFPASTSRARVVLDTLAAFSDGGVLSFALATLRRQRRMAAALVGAMWLAFAGVVLLLGERWCPSVPRRAAWLALLVATSLVALALGLRWRRGLSWALVLLLGLQSLLGIFLLWHLGTVTPLGMLEWAFGAGTILTPAVAAFLVAHAAIVDEGRMPQ